MFRGTDDVRNARIVIELPSASGSADHRVDRNAGRSAGRAGHSGRSPTAASPNWLRRCFGSTHQTTLLPPERQNPSKPALVQFPKLSSFFFTSTTKNLVGLPPVFGESPTCFVRHVSRPVGYIFCRGGTPWPPLSCSFRITKERGGHGVPPLQRTSMFFYEPHRRLAYESLRMKLYAPAERRYIAIFISFIDIEPRCVPGM